MVGTDPRITSGGGHDGRNETEGIIDSSHWHEAPAWLTRLNPDAELDFTVSFLRNRSTLSSANYTQWEGGPALVLGWRF